MDFAKNCDLLIGSIGSLLGFPSRGSVFVHPISDKKQFNTAYNKIAEMTNKFFDSEAGPISRNIYWFYNNKYIKFGMVSKGDELTYDIPDELLELLNMG